MNLQQKTAPEGWTVESSDGNVTISFKAKNSWFHKQFKCQVEQYQECINALLEVNKQEQRCCNCGDFWRRIKQEGTGKFLMFSGLMQDILQQVKPLVHMSNGILYIKGNISIMDVNDIVTILDLTRESNVGLHTEYDDKIFEGKIKVYVWLSESD